MEKNSYSNLNTHVRYIRKWERPAHPNRKIFERSHMKLYIKCQ